MDRRLVVTALMLAALTLGGIGILRRDRPAADPVAVDGPHRAHLAGELAPTAARRGTDARFRQGTGEPGERPARGAASGLVDVNRASAQELERLPGIGPARARAIIEERQRRGGFRHAEDLVDVKGIGPATLASIRPLITLGDGTAPPPRPSAAGAPVGGRVNINRASARELQSLKGVGPVLAEAIVRDRAANGPYRRVEDLARVKGIGPTIVRNNRDRMVVTEP